MIRRALYETRIAIHPGVWAIPAVFAILRFITDDSQNALLPILETAYPVLYPLLAFSLIEHERRRRTAEVLVTTPGSKAGVLVLRLAAIVLPLFCVVAVCVHPSNWLIVLPAGFLLTGVTLLVGLFFGSEIGLAVALGWWALSFAAMFGGAGLLQHPAVSWVSLIQPSASLTRGALLLRKSVQLGAGILLISASAHLFAKRYWRGFLR